ncbi:uncharacterized protein LOC115229813 [Octopus sinensis]|uniref:Carbohydrate sulfotransferase n=1 Tax=Octopus sinensis TaxID=2607531 RepID=A0A6P7U4U6_9MOLL|nr:uncharacterized protein LOC115229813 [Octopus sinensis]
MLKWLLMTYCIKNKIKNCTRFSQNEIHEVNYIKTYEKNFINLNSINNMEGVQKILIVRHPAERIVSAYLNKFIYETKNAGKSPHYVQQVRQALTGYPEEFVTFEQFVSYLINNSQKASQFNEHWALMSDLCLPGYINYKIIYLEQLDEFIQHLFKIYGLTEKGMFWIKDVTHKTNSVDYVSKYFLNLTTEMKYAFYNLYKNDHLYFGFKPYL